MLKDFSGEAYVGKVVGWLGPTADGDPPVWCVLYHDGDAEDVEADELDQIVARFSRSSSGRRHHMPAVGRLEAKWIAEQDAIPLPPPALAGPPPADAADASSRRGEPPPEASRPAADSAAATSGKRHGTEPSAASGRGGSKRRRAEEEEGGSKAVGSLADVAGGSKAGGGVGRSKGVGSLAEAKELLLALANKLPGEKLDAETERLEFETQLDDAQSPAQLGLLLEWIGSLVPVRAGTDQARRAWQEACSHVDSFGQVSCPTSVAPAP